MSADDGPLVRSLRLRPAEATDVPELCTLHFASFSVQSTRRFIARVYYPVLLAPGSSGFGFVAVRDRRIVGFCVGVLDQAALEAAMLRRHPVECLFAAVAKLYRGRQLARRRPGGGARVHYVAVEPGERRAGTARRLSMLVHDVIRHAGHTCCWTRVSRFNEPALRLQERLGLRHDVARSDPHDELQEYRLEFPVG